MNKIQSYLLFVAGLVLIICGFCYLAPEKSDRYLVGLNIIVSCIIYFLFFIDVLFPISRTTQSGQSRLASLGVRWFVIPLYSVIAIGLMLWFNLSLHAALDLQIIVHSALLFVLALSLVGAKMSWQKTMQVRTEQAQSFSQIDQMRARINSLTNTVQMMPNLALGVKEKIMQLQDDLRYISPSNNPQAWQQEKEILDTLKKMEHELSLHPKDSVQLMQTLQRCHQLYQNRKNNYSN